MAGRITVYPEGSKTGVVLTDTHHLATGGEASVYLRDNVVYKIYTDPAKALSRGIDRKLVLLRALAHPGIAAPTGLILDKAGGPIGLTMPFVAGDPLCKLFTNTWRDPRQFGPAETGKLVDNMREIVQVAHGANAIMVDANELNWIAGGVNGTVPVAIDVDSWQLPGFPATVIMPSIADHSSTGQGHDRFNQGTDWFAWAIVTYNLWTGIHPYKGTHPKFGRGRLEERMRARASVFEPGVQLPPAARDATLIPPRLLAWYERTFQTTERTAPPRAGDSAIGPQTVRKLQVLQSSAGTLKIELLATLDSRVAAAANGFLVLVPRSNTGGGRTGGTPPAVPTLWDATTRTPVAVPDPGALDRLLQGKGVLLRRPAARLLLDIVGPASSGEARTLRAVDLDARPQSASSSTTSSLGVSGARLWQAHNRAFVLVDGDPNGLHEVEVAHMGQAGATQLVAGVARRWPCNVLSTTFLRNVFVQDAFGTPIVSVVTPDGGMHHAAVDGLKGHKVIDGFAPDVHNIWLSAKRVRDGELIRFRMHFEGEKVIIDHEDIVDEPDIEAAVVTAGPSTGVAVLRMRDELLATKGAARKLVSCPGLSSSLRLFGAGASIAAFDGQQVAKLSLG